LEEGSTERAPRGGWDSWKGAAKEFARSARDLVAIRWEMASQEAGAWGKAMAFRAAFLVLAAVLAVLAAALLVAGTVAALYVWWGTLVGAIFAVFGLCLFAVAGLVVAAMRGRSGRPIFERTGAELRRDFDAFTGPEP
jgi:predicted lysophospholipase L1 biosynthesis ABC-type transport system permease subunit